MYCHALPLAKPHSSLKTHLKWHLLREGKVHLRSPVHGTEYALGECWREGKEGEGRERGKQRRVERNGLVERLLKEGQSASEGHGVN